MKLKNIDNAEQIRGFIINQLGVDVFKDTDKRLRYLVEARALFYKLALETNPKLTLQALADLFNKNHATVIYSINLYDDVLCLHLDVHRNIFLATYYDNLKLSNNKQSLLRNITSKVLKIKDTEELELFENKIKELINN